MEYVIRVFRLREHGDFTGKYMDLQLPGLNVDQWLAQEASHGFDLDSLTDLLGGEHFFLRVVVKRDRPEGPRPGLGDSN